VCGGCDIILMLQILKYFWPGHVLWRNFLSLVLYLLLL
jgi:hypothetical protein